MIPNPFSLLAALALLAIGFLLAFGWRAGHAAWDLLRTETARIVVIIIIIIIIIIVVFGLVR